MSNRHSTRPRRATCVGQSGAANWPRRLLGAATSFMAAIGLAASGPGSGSAFASNPAADFQKGALAWRAGDVTAAATAWRLAADAGDPVANMRLGEMLAEGRGIPRDLVAAFVRYNIANTLRVSGAREARAAIAARMTRAQRDQARLLSLRIWDRVAAARRVRGPNGSTRFRSAPRPASTTATSTLADPTPPRPRQVWSSVSSESPPAVRSPAVRPKDARRSDTGIFTASAPHRDPLSLVEAEIQRLLVETDALPKIAPRQLQTRLATARVPSRPADIFARPVSISVQPRLPAPGAAGMAGPTPAAVPAGDWVADGAGDWIERRHPTPKPVTANVAPGATTSLPTQRNTLVNDAEFPAGGTVSERVSFGDWRAEAAPSTDGQAAETAGLADTGADDDNQFDGSSAPTAQTLAIVAPTVVASTGAAREEAPAGAAEPLAAKPRSETAAAINPESDSSEPPIAAPNAPSVNIAGLPPGAIDGLSRRIDALVRIALAAEPAAESDRSRVDTPSVHPPSTQSSVAPAPSQPKPVRAHPPATARTTPLRPAAPRSTAPRTTQDDLAERILAVAMAGHTVEQPPPTSQIRTRTSAQPSPEPQPVPQPQPAVGRPPSGDLSAAGNPGADAVERLAARIRRAVQDALRDPGR